MDSGVFTASFLIFLGEQGEFLLPEARFGGFFDNSNRRQFRERLEELLKRYAAAPAPPTALDAKDREHLEALGYLDGDEASPSDAARDGTP